MSKIIRISILILAQIASTLNLFQLVGYAIYFTTQIYTQNSVTARV